MRGFSDRLIQVRHTRRTCTSCALDKPKKITGFFKSDLFPGLQQT